MLRRVHIRIIPPEGHREDSYTYKAPPHKFYRLEDEDKVCERVIEHLDKRYPWWEFKMVKVGAGKYNFVYVGLREQRPELSEENKNDESLHRSQQD